MPDPAAKRADLFSSRFALILAALGMAIGAGNIWRFPRIMAKFEGGGTFLIPWAIFLFSWSIPLLIAETAIGRKTRKGVIGSLGQMLGPKRAWLGAFVALCTIAIMCYYAVVAGWCGIYILESLRGEVAALDATSASDYFKTLAQGGWSVLATVLAFGIAAAFVARGLRRGIELANKILLPTLFALLLVLVVTGLSREGSGEGVAWMLSVDWPALATPTPWLEAASQSAWSTGAGWGLLLVLSVGSRERKNSVADACVTGVGNNVASLVAAFATIPAVFALAPLAAPGSGPVQVLQENGPGNTGMAMVWLPRLFAEIGGAGGWLCALFFVALTFAALTSLIAMLELATRTLMDLGLERARAIRGALGIGVIFGLPSALSLDFLSNQDWVWGLGLLVSGFLVALAVLRTGCARFRHEWIAVDGVGAPGAWFDLLIAVLIPLQFVVLLGWWFWQTIHGEWASNQWSPLEPFSVGTCLLQWALAFAVLRAFNRHLTKTQGDA